MDIPRGHAMLPLNEADFLDFIYNYFKAEYAPIRSFFSTATAEPRQAHRWVNAGHEMTPLHIRAANAQSQKDLESLDYFTRKWNLDAGFVRGIVIRFAKYEVHERLEKKLFENCRLDLMVRKALKEKHLIDALWPSPAPKNLPQELLRQGVQVRSWYGDMFSKYFRHLHAVDDFTLRPDVDAKIRASGTLMLFPYVDHLIFGAVDPIMPIVAKGAGYANAAAWKQKDKAAAAFGQPEHFEVRFDAPAEVEETYTRNVTRQCQCLKCGAKRDVKVTISVDPNPGPVAQQTPGKERRTSNPNVGAKRQSSKAAQRYSPGYVLPGTDAATQPQRPPRQRRPARHPEPEPEPPAPAELPGEVRATSPVQKKQCPRCTFLNHPDIVDCEMCGADLPETLVAKPPSPVATAKKSSHAHSASEPPTTTADKLRKEETPSRPAAPNRHSLSSTLFSIFPFSQQQQTEHHANLPSTQPKETPEVRKDRPQSKLKEEVQPEAKAKHNSKTNERDHETEAATKAPSTPPNLIDSDPTYDREPVFNQTPEMAMMPMTPPPTSSHGNRPFVTGLPQNLMDDFVPVSPSYRNEQEEEDAGWGEVSKEEAKREDSSGDEDEEDIVDRREGMIDLDIVAREEMGVWGDKEDD
ncbi:hypothetical protein BDV96DRAFT_633398 [Lophiotrema nucula]|uniref:RanBP2-type domain-containing protein n=1 Tax=Lophiotrema nucula TaxID=690887 RepID=A0A6A5Z1K9_9PLEO|nr:hypothetical protein BDV96DRAFT_633398 [Lophiotrema nucula]